MDTPATTPTRRTLANAIRALSMDAVQAANSGHPGAPMGMADIAEVLWRDVLKHNPGNPGWWNRDRFVLSNGHGSMLLYSLLHLSGYPLTIDDIKKFRQLGSHTAGHPERDLRLGIETTTGPLGQGLGQRGRHGARREVVSRAVQQRRPGDRRSPHLLFRRRRLPHGRHLARSRLARRHAQARQARSVFYDDNGISIDGKVVGWFTDDTPKRFEAYGWHVIRNVDGHDSRRGRRGHQEGAQSQGSAVAHLLQDHHRLGCA